jgi:hypothetical protein
MDAQLLPFEEWAVLTFTLVAEHSSLSQIVQVAQALIELRSYPIKARASAIANGLFAVHARESIDLPRLASNHRTLSAFCPSF